MFTLYHCCVVSPFVFIGLMWLLCIAVVLFSLYFYWFDVLTLYRCCVVFLVFLLVWCDYFVSLLCCFSFCFYWFDVFTLYRCYVISPCSFVDFYIFSLYHCCVVFPSVFIGLMGMFCIVVLLFVRLFIHGVECHRTFRGFFCVSWLSRFLVVYVLLHIIKWSREKKGNRKCV